MTNTPRKLISKTVDVILNSPFVVFVVLIFILISFIEQPCREELINWKNPTSHPSIDWTPCLRSHERDTIEVNWLIRGSDLDGELIEIIRSENLFVESRF